MTAAMHGRRRHSLGICGLALAIGVATSLGGVILTAARAAAPTPAPAAPGAPATPTPPATDPKILASLRTPQGRDAFTAQYCASCHSARGKAGGLVLEGQSSARPSDRADLWEKVVKRVAAGEMPPARAAHRPDAEAAHLFAASLVAELDAAGRNNPYAGPTVVRRLNRTEYANAVRDLLGVDFPFTAELPADGRAGGFDTVGDALSLSPVLLESYLKVGRKVSELAVGIADTGPVSDVYPVTSSQSEWIRGAPFGTRGGVVVRKYFPREGDYELRAFLEDVGLTPVEGKRFFRAKVHVQPGPHTFVATFADDYADREGAVPTLSGPGGFGLGGPLDVQGTAWRPSLLFLLDGKKLKTFGIEGPAPFEARLSGPPIMARAEISGPEAAGPPAPSASRDRIFICRPRAAADEAACAEKILTPIARRAFRREVTPEDLRPILATYQRERASRDFDGAVASAIRQVLVSPDFLFRLEFDPKTAKAGRIRRVNDFEMASRLSFFLWSSIPDEDLLDAARRGELHSRPGLERQTRRMLADPRADALVDNFASQWLGLADIAEARADPDIYLEYDTGLNDTYLTETKLFLRNIMRENRPILDVIDADYTFVNGRLARLYGIDGVEGPGFRKVKLAEDSPRRGILGQGGILMVTSHPDATSPILRGKWVLDSLLNSPPPPPPAGVPPLSKSAAPGKVTSIREQIERHRANPACASCHARMDPYGFALENFDVMGRWRTNDRAGKVDASAQLPGGEAFSGPAGVRKVLLAHSDRFVDATVARMMTYALSRELNGRDQPTVRSIVSAAKPGGYRFKDIVLAVIESTPFQYKETSR